MGALLLLLPGPGERKANVAIADVCRCAVGPRSRTGHQPALATVSASAQPGNRTDPQLPVGSSSCLAAVVAKAGWGMLGMQGCSWVSPWGMCVLGGELPVSHELLEQGLESVLVLLDPAPGEPGGHPSPGWAGRHPAGMRALWGDQAPLPGLNYSSFCLFLK